MKYFLIVLIPILLILSNTLSLFYDVDFYAESELDSSEILEVIGFFEGGELTLYETDELSHMEDVRSLVNIGNALLVLLIILIAVVFAYSDKTEWWFMAGAIVALLILLLFVLIDFNSFFVGFHSLFFPQGNWEFASDSLIKTHFPNSFFYLAGIKIFFNTIWQSGVLVLISGLGLFFKKIYKTKKNTSS